MRVAIARDDDINYLLLDKKQIRNNDLFLDEIVSALHVTPLVFSHI